MIEKQQHRKNLKEFRNFLIEDINRLRQERGLSLDELIEQSHIPHKELYKISSGVAQNWGALHQLSRFFDKKIRIVFY